MVENTINKNKGTISKEKECLIKPYLQDGGRGKIFTLLGKNFMERLDVTDYNYKADIGYPV
jgi:hypothetical protein